MNIKFVCNVKNGISNGSILFLAFENEVRNATGQKAKNSNLKADPVIKTEDKPNMREVECVMQIVFTCEVKEEMTNLELLRVVLEEGVINVTGQKPNNGRLEAGNKVYEGRARNAICN